jgi:hypothetical protein
MVSRKLCEKANKNAGLAHFGNLDYLKSKAPAFAENAKGWGTPEWAIEFYSDVFICCSFFGLQIGQRWKKWIIRFQYGQLCLSASCL